MRFSFSEKCIFIGTLILTISLTFSIHNISPGGYINNQKNTEVVPENENNDITKSISNSNSCPHQQLRERANDAMDKGFFKLAYEIQSSVFDTSPCNIKKCKSNSKKDAKNLIKYLHKFYQCNEKAKEYFENREHSFHYKSSFYNDLPVSEFLSNSVGTTYLLAIGIDDYKEKSITNIPNVVTDIRLIEEAIKANSPNLQVTSLIGKNATKQNIIETLISLRASVTQGDKIVVYFTGHGITFPLNKTIDNYNSELEFNQFIMPYNFDNDNAVETGIALNEIKALVDGITDNPAILIVDACRDLKIPNEFDYLKDLAFDKQPYLFNSNELDEETGLYYYGARYYDSSISDYSSVKDYVYVSNDIVRDSEKQVDAVEVVNKGCRQDWNTLSSFYYNIGEPNWIKNSGWEILKSGIPTNGNFTNLSGIEVNSTFHVIGINLDSNLSNDLLEGAIPNYEDIPKLTSLNLSLNKFESDFPSLPNFGQIQNLQGLVYGKGYGYPDIVNTISNYQDNFGHGTYGAMAITDDLTSYYNIELTPLKMFNDQRRGNLFKMICALYHSIDHEANIVNISVGNREAESLINNKDTVIYAYGENIEGYESCEENIVASGTSFATYFVSKALAIEFTKDKNRTLNEIYTDFESSLKDSVSYNVLAHELGHPIGFYHTHACKWSDNRKLCNNQSSNFGQSDSKELALYFDINGDAYPDFLTSSQDNTDGIIGPNGDREFGGNGPSLNNKDYNYTCISNPSAIVINATSIYDKAIYSKKKKGSLFTQLFAEALLNDDSKITFSELEKSINESMKNYNNGQDSQSMEIEFIFDGYDLNESLGEL